MGLRKANRIYRELHIRVALPITSYRPGIPQVTGFVLHSEVGLYREYVCQSFKQHVARKSTGELGLLYFDTWVFAGLLSIDASKNNYSLARLFCIYRLGHAGCICMRP